MVSQVPRLWKQLLQQLEATPDSIVNGQLDSRAVQDIFFTAASLHGQPAPCKATWKKLVKDMQIPARLCAACFQQPGQHQLMALPFALALDALLRQAMAMQGLKHAAPSSTNQSLLQQLEECGMLHHLSRQLSATAHQLWDMQSPPADLATQLQEPAYKHTDRWGTGSSPLWQLHRRAGLLCSVVYQLHEIMSDAEPRWHKLLRPLLAVPAVELSVLTLQHVSSCLDHLPLQLQQVPPNTLWCTLAQAKVCASIAVEWRCSHCSCCEEVRQQLQQSPYCIMAISITLLVASYTSLMAKDALAQASTRVDHPAAITSGSSWDGGSNMGGGSSSSSSRDPAIAHAASADPTQTQQQLQPAQQQLPQQQRQPQQLPSDEQAAWDMACARHESLPVSHQELLRLTGCSGKALLWVSGSHDRTVAELGEMVDACCAFFATCKSLRISQAQQQPAEGSEQFSLGITAMLFLVPVVVLHWGSYYLAGCANEVKLRAALLNIIQVCATGTMLLADQWCLIAGQVLARKRQLLQQLQHVVQQLEDMEQQDEGELINLALQGRELISQALLPEGGDALQQFLQQTATLQRGLCHKQNERRLVPLQPAVVVVVVVLQPAVWPPGVYLQVLGEVLQLGEKVLLLLLQHVAASSSNNGTGSCSSIAMISQSGPSQLQASCAGQIAGYLSALQTRYMAEFVSGAPGDDDWPRNKAYPITATNPPLPPQAVVWFHHAPQLCGALEAFVRQQAGVAETEEELKCECEFLHLMDPLDDRLNGVLLQAAAAAGPCSKQQVPLYCLLRSMVKWAAALDSIQGQQQKQKQEELLLLEQQRQQRRLADELRATVAVSAATMLARSYVGCPKQLTETAAPTTTDTVELPADGSVCTCDASSSGGNVGNDSYSDSCSSLGREQGVKANSLHVLPWLGLLGCCCLQWSAQLQQHPEPDPQPMQKNIRASTAGVLCSLHVDSTWDVFFRRYVHHCNDGKPGTVWGDVCQPLREWCAMCTSAEVLQAAGYDLQPLLRQLDVTAAAVQAAAAASDGAGGPQGVESLAAVIQQLAALGQALSSVAHKRSCNNPACPT